MTNTTTAPAQLTELRVGDRVRYKTQATGTATYNPAAAGWEGTVVDPYRNGDHGEVRWDNGMRRYNAPFLVNLELISEPKADDSFAERPLQRDDWKVGAKVRFTTNVGINDTTITRGCKYVELPEVMEFITEMKRPGNDFGWDVTFEVELVSSPADHLGRAVIEFPGGSISYSELCDYTSSRILVAPAPELEKTFDVEVTEHEIKALLAVALKVGGDPDPAAARGAIVSLQEKFARAAGLNDSQVTRDPAYALGSGAGLMFETISERRARLAQ
jgi:hypothetical protein